ncbi:NADPH:quinone oxidoreductase family protein [Cupriavidus pinatubonensis]|uniref:NADPH:quinone oxidoreductase family protein n=2 Tax=Cupriavidus pinatubonensis TaxID=248026 RepID=UPI001C73D0A4|nr:NADPH:quinone oxidoreductase family protein [Cupriavidus pinatubonensis]QYY30124.1 NADPH:quinone oxidoreductase family protein [Cupriavidus pinatubonensis]
MGDYLGLVCSRWCHWSELELQRIARRPLAPGQVRIRVRHAGVGFALSLFVSGKYQRKPPLPFTPGTEAAGEIIEVAPDVTRLRPGQRVAAALDWGGFAQEVVTTADTVYPVPDALDLASAAALPVTYGTVWAALAWRAVLQPGETMLVHGASGSLGTAAVQVGRLMGARVIATASTEAKREAALHNGAAHALSSDPQSLAAEVKALCPAGGVDVVFDPVGGDLFDASLRCAAPGGRLLSIGYAGGRIPEVPANLLLVKNLSVIGFNYGYYIGWGLTDERSRFAPQVQDVVGKIMHAVANREMPKPVLQHFGLHQWLEAVDTTMSRRAIGKVMLDMP